MATLDGIELSIVFEIAHIDVHAANVYYSEHTLNSNSSNVRSLDHILGFDGCTVLVSILAIGKTCLGIVCTKNNYIVNLVLGHCLFDEETVTGIGCGPTIHCNTTICLTGNLCIQSLTSHTHLPWV